MTIPVVLSYGMGVDSTAILLRWLDEPASRDFDLRDLVLLTAMTGDEFADTGRLVAAHVLPRLHRSRVRFVQLARAGPQERDGVKVLDDSRMPRVLHLAGAYPLSRELQAAGTIPQAASGRRLCSLKFKGWVLDTWLTDELDGQPFRHVMGFNSDEGRRVRRDRSYSTVQRRSEYPLVTWGWDRPTCERYLFDLVGERWPKSCCSYCPFAANRAGLPALLSRYRRFPEAAVQAMLLEVTSTALNPNMLLFGNRSVRRLVAADQNQAALAALEAALAACDYTLYDVRRLFRPRAADPSRPAISWRSVQHLATGSEAAVLDKLRQRAHAAGRPVLSNDHVHRVVLRPRGLTLPTKEHLLVVAPVGVQTKQRPGFETLWRSTTEADAVQPTLLTNP
jgi:hypothetical protein